MPASPPRHGSLLIVGYGNTLRQDDGVGPHVAGRIEELNLPGVETLACPQLSPEHAEVVARARTVVFVDAAAGGQAAVRLRRLHPEKSSQVTTHAAGPGTLLALARDVYGRAPRAWMLALPAPHLGYGEEFSAIARCGAEEAVRVLRTFVQVRRLHSAPVREMPGRR